MQDVKAVLFDTFGTIVDWRGSLIAELSTFGQARGLAADWQALVDRWRGAYRPQMDRVRRGDLPWTILDVLHRDALDSLLPEFGLGHLDQPDRVWMTLGWHRLKPWPDALEGLARIRCTRIVGPLSNGNLSLLVDLAKAASLPWDVVFGTDMFGHYKPDPEVYLGACSLLGLPPRSVMLCAAHNDDLEAASSLGLRTAFVPRPLEYGPGQTQTLEPSLKWDLQAADLIELAGLFA